MSENGKLKSEECVMTVEAMITLGQMAMLIPAEEYLEMLERFDSFGMFIDPTGWIRSKDNLDQQKILARAVCNFKLELEKIRRLGIEQKGR